MESEEINLGNGESITEIDLEGYKYLGTKEADKIKENEMKEIFLKEYLKRIKLIMRSNLKDENKIMAVNIWAVSFT